MLCGYSTAGIFDGDFSLRRADRDRDQDRSTSGSEAQSIFHEIAHRPAEKHGVGIDIAFAGASNRDVVLFSERFIEGRDFLDRSSSVEERLLDVPFRGFGPGEEKADCRQSRRVSRFLLRSIR